MFSRLVRNFRKYPAFSLINLGGLSIGIAASFILLVYSQREMSCDRHFRDAGKIVRIGTDFFNMGGFAKSQFMLRDLLQGSCKDVQYATALDRSSDEVPVRTSREDRAFTGTYPYYTDASFFNVFSYEAEKGVIPEQGLAPGEVILSAANARRFFNREDPIGQTLFIGKENRPYTVVAVLRETFGKSHLDPQLLLPEQPEQHAASPINWNSVSVYNYVKIKEAGSEAGLNSWLNRLLEKVVYPASGERGSFAQWKAGSSAVKFIIQPLTDIYFHSDLKFDMSPGGNLTQVRLLSAVSLFLILLAIINYINLVTARSSIRSREIGVKKTFGASRRNLIIQMIRESVLFSFLAMLLACGLIQVILWGYQSVTHSDLTGPMPLLQAHYGWLALFSLGVGILAGIYPAFYLTAFRPILSMRSLTGLPGKGNPRVRNALVLLQFVIASSLVFISFVIYGQLQFMKNKDKGFRTEGVVLVENAGELRGKAAAFRNLVAQQSQVVSASFCQRMPAGNSISMFTYRTPAMATDLTLQTFPVDDQYISTLGMHLRSGRNFNKDLVSDTNSLILNESAVAALGLFDPVGATINGSERVIGVVKDFNFASLREKIEPVVLRYAPQGGYLAIRIRGGQTASFPDRLQALGKELQLTEPLTISFLDDNFAQLAAKEKILGAAIHFFTILAILLATLGLTGLILFTIERRTKEIGIRKVLGAGLSDILKVVSGDFIRLAALSSLIALPLSWWLMHRWLESFAYRISVGIRTFLMTESIIMLMAFSVIGLLTLRAAATDPVKTLRSQ